MNAQYHYLPLKSRTDIRLVELQPGDHDATLVCRLVPTALDKNPPYEALSYVWGSIEDPCEMQCDGHPFYITKSLSESLRRLRLPSARRLLWADAI
jgi:hypothetical protein